MKVLFASTVVVGLIASAGAVAAPPANAPAGSTGLCNDGTYSSSAEKKGACHGHKGVKAWYGESLSTSPANTSTSTKNMPVTAATTTTAKTASPGTTRPVAAPAGAMGLCNDGTYSSSAEKKGACHGHKGVKEWWYGEAASPSPVPTAISPQNMPAAPAITTTGTTKTASPDVAARTSSEPMATGQTPRAAAGQVWVNEDTKVYHCSGDKWYGKTKRGAYMSEADAKAKGNHADHGKACG